MIAGFERPTSGQVLLHGEDVIGTPPFDRDVNTVFQDYALFPHLSVGRNVEYGLKVKKVPKATRRGQALEALELVRLAGYEDRKISELSGGQRQRVALARALVNRPRVLLLDEPLGALDLKLREEMQHELKRIQTEVGITFIYVTHDQDEALGMSDLLAVFNEGHLEQVGTPTEVYEHPASPFVAGFVGTSNLISGELAHRLRGTDEPFTVRPEKIQLLPAGGAAGPDSPEVRATGTIRSALYLGERTRYTIDLDGGGELTAVEQNRTASSSDVRTKTGAAVRLAWERQCDQVLAVDGLAATN
jgi:putative spermidine/putrescine transport system ATP-binding protein